MAKSIGKSFEKPKGKPKENKEPEKPKGDD